jgi:hypothetical protein
MCLTEAPLPPSLAIAGGYSSLSNPLLVSTPRNESLRLDAAPFLSIVIIAGCPSACASSICCADAGYRFLSICLVPPTYNSDYL